MEDNILLLLSLVDSMSMQFYSLEKAYDSMDKENFEIYKGNILEIQKKIDSLIN